MQQRPTTGFRLHRLGCAINENRSTIPSKANHRFSVFIRMCAALARRQLISAAMQNQNEQSNAQRNAQPLQLSPCIGAEWMPITEHTTHTHTHHLFIQSEQIERCFCIITNQFQYTYCRANRSSSKALVLWWINDAIQCAVVNIFTIECICIWHGAAVDLTNSNKFVFWDQIDICDEEESAMNIARGERQLPRMLLISFWI